MLPEGTLLWLQRCDFRTVESLFSLTAVTQNMHDLRRCPCEASTTFFVHIILRNGYKAPPKFLGRLRLGELRRQPLQNVPQKAPQLTALKPPSTARTAGRSDQAERRFRRQPFILLSFSSLEKLRKAQEMQSYQRFQHIGRTAFNTFGTNGPTFAFTGESGYALAFAQRIAHSGSHGETRGVSDGGWYHYPRRALRVTETLDARLSKRLICRFPGLVTSSLISAA